MEDRRKRAEARRQSVVLTKVSLGEDRGDEDRVAGPTALSLVTELSRLSWSMAGLPVPTYSRDEIPVRFVSRDARD